MRKLKYVIAALLFVLVLSSAVHENAAAETVGTETGTENISELRTWNGFSYQVVNNKEITICGYTQAEDSSFVLPDTIENLPVTNIADSAFKGNEDIYEVVIGKNVKRIGRDAFRESGLVTVAFADSDTTLEVANGAFYRLQRLQQVTFGNREILLGSYAFYGAAILEEIKVPSSVKAGNISESGVREEATSLFSSCDSLRKAEVFMEAVPNYMFRDCTALKKVTLNSGVTSIGDYAFSSCASLTDVVFSEGLKALYYGAFSDCSTLSSIELPSTVRIIENHVFIGCTMLEELQIPESCISFDRMALRNCTNLKRLTVEDGNTAFSADGKVLYDKEQTRVIMAAEKAYGDVVLPDTVRSIDNEAFWNCKAIEHVTLPEGLVTIGERAFYGCSKLQEIVVPDSVQGILDGTFEQCSSLETAELGSGITGLDRTFIGCRALKSVELTDNCQIFGDASFDNCESLVDVRIPEGVKELGEWCFYGCASLEKLKMPKSLQSVGFRTLQYCSSLKELTFYENLSYVSSIWYAMADNESLQYAFFRGPYVALSDNVFDNMDGGFVVFYREQYPEWKQYTKYPTVAVTDAMLEMKEYLAALKLADVKMEDRETLNGCRAAYEALGDKEQRFYLEEELNVLEGALRKVYALEVEQRIIALPDAGDVAPEDKEQIRSVAAEYASLSNVERGYIKPAQRQRIGLITKALDELLAVKEILLGKPVVKTDGVYELSLAVGEAVNVPVAITPDYAEDKKLDVETEGQDQIVSAGMNREATLTVTGKAVGKITVYIRYRDKLEVPVQVRVVPSVPEDLKIGLRGSATAELTWDKAEGADYYMIYRRAGSEAERLLAVTNGNIGIHVDSQLTPGTVYTYRLVACAEPDGEKYTSGFSRSVQVAVPKKESAKPIVTPPKPSKPSAAAKVKKPAAPTKVKAVRSGKRNVKLSWKKVKGASGYKIYRSTKKSGKYKVIKTVKKGSTVKYLNKKLSAKTYYYKVRAYKKVNKKTVYGKYSKIVKIRVKK